MSQASSAAIILAAGQGKRMHSGLPKVLHLCAERPLVCHVIELALHHGCSPVVVVVAPDAAAQIEQEVRQRFPDQAIAFALQPVPRGTGDALRAGFGALGSFSGRVFVLYGDVPLLTAATLQTLHQALTTDGAALAFLTAHVADPQGYGRVVRSRDGRVQRIVEERDATAEERLTQEVNAGVYLADVGFLRDALTALAPQNSQNEYYLTDIVQTASARVGAIAVPVRDTTEVRGVNSRWELMAAEKVLRRRILRRHAESGVMFHDVKGTWVGPDVHIGRDVDIGMGVQLYGHTRIADGVRIEGPSVIIDSTLGRDVVVHHFSHLERCTVEAEVTIGPYARLRPDAYLEMHVRVGNFVEVKKARLGRGAKVNHLSYVGDAQVGAETNIGAGTVVCNYDGYNKHLTQIGANAFVGSNSTLVAPVVLEDRAFVAAGSVITKNVLSDDLAFGRAQQVNRSGLGKALRDKLRAVANKKKEGG